MIHKKSKADSLRELTGEVQHLHPLLRDLLPKLEGVRYVEYTHGPNEKGADFVLEKEDSAFKDTVYVGVIVKKGPIRSDFTDIERQIDECKQPRNVRNGNKKIVLSEIWVISNDSITENAKDKISFKYAGTSIRFSDVNALVEWIDKYIEYYWYSVPTDIGDYLSTQWRKNREAEIQSVLVPGLELFYLPLDIAKIDDYAYDKTRRSKVQFIQIEKELSKNNVILLEGEMGSGKSKIVRTLISELSEARSYTQTNHIPIVLSYKEFIENKYSSLEDCIKDKMKAAYKICKNNKTVFVVFLDGLDEVLDVSGSETSLLEQIINEAKSSENIKLFITSRPLKLLEEKAGLYRSISRYRIYPLNLKKINSFLEQYCTKINISTRIIENIKKSDLFKQLPQSPIAAILLSRLLTEDTKELPQNLTELYQKVSEIMLGRWDIEKGLLSQKEYDTADRVIGELAKYMIDNNLGVISRVEAKQYFERYINSRNIDINVDHLFNNILQRSHILGEDNTSGIIYFRHRSFAEYFYARNAINESHLSINQKVFSLYWQNIYFFYLGIKKDCPELLRQILATPPRNEGERWLKVINMGNYFMAGFLSPYSIVEDNLYKLFIEAAELYEQALSGNSETRLKELPEMHSLWLIQYLMRNGYSFEYFRRALDSSALHLSEDITSRRKKAYALFLLCVVCIDLNEEEPFRYLLKEIHTEELPLPLGLALECEMQIKKELGYSNMMKKHRKKFRKIIRNNKILGKEVQHLFHSPAKMLKRHTD